VQKRIRARHLVENTITSYVLPIELVDELCSGAFALRRFSPLNFDEYGARHVAGA